MTKELENLKKKIIYRASYRGTKEMDILLSSFVKKYLNTFSKNELMDLEDFLNFRSFIFICSFSNCFIFITDNFFLPMFILICSQLQCSNNHSIVMSYFSVHLCLCKNL